MGETVNQEGNSTEPAKTFTQAEVDAIIGDRLKREREKFADYSDLKTKAEEYDKQQAASKSELQKEQEKSAALQKEIEAMKKKSTIAEARAKVAKDTGVPIECLSGEDEDSCKAQAEAILKFAKPSGYPGVRKDTPPKKNSSSGTDDDMREFARQLFSR